MKRTILSVFGLLSVGVLSAQTIVSTSPSNKVAVLEEFTGVNCQHCPGGHELAQQTKDVNPEMVLVNVHVGPYANATPDYRTAWGTALDNQADVGGYPAVQMNRREDLVGVNYQLSGAAFSWTNLATGAAAVMAEPSPVNIAIKPSYNEATSEVSVLVEVYYTSSTLTTLDTIDNLTVAVLQSNIKGPQIDGPGYYPQNRYADGDYNHAHMLRDFITGQWGVQIEPTGASYFWDSTFVFTLPATYGAIPTVWQDIEIAAYIADNQKNIFTGTSEWLVPEENQWNITTTTVHSAGDNFCATASDFDVTVLNDGPNTLNSFDIIYTVNEGPQQVAASYSGTMATGQSETFNISIDLEAGINTIAFEKLSNVNGGTLFNPKVKGFFSIPEGGEEVRVNEGLEIPIQGGFEDDEISKTPTNGVYAYESHATYPPRVISEDWPTFIDPGLTVGGHGESEQSLWFALGYNTIDAGTSLSVVTDNYDFSGYETAKLSFAYAYAQLSSGEDSEFTVDISTDCGENWETVLSMEGDDMETAGVDEEYIVIPEEDEWEDKSVDLSEYALESAVMIRFRITKDEGNGFFLDDINVSGTPAGVSSLDDQGQMTLFPNPASSVLNFDGVKAANAVLQIRDIQGRLVMNTTLIGTSIDVSELTTGVYTVSVETENSSVIEKLTIVK